MPTDFTNTRIHKVLKFTVFTNKQIHKIIKYTDLTYPQILKLITSKRQSWGVKFLICVEPILMWTNKYGENIKWNDVWWSNLPSQFSNFQMGQKCKWPDIGKETLFENLSLWLKQLQSCTNKLRQRCKFFITLLKSVFISVCSITIGKNSIYSLYTGGSMTFRPYI